MSANGTPVTLPPGSAMGLANYPHGRWAPQSSTKTFYISGTSCRQADGSFAGVTEMSDGSLAMDIREQTRGILRNLEAIIKTATNNKGGLENIIDATVFLTDIQSHYSGMNEVWNETWPDFLKAPARTTIGVKELPSPKMIVEIKCTAVISEEGLIA